MTAPPPSPRAAVETALADATLPPAELAQRLLDTARRTRRLNPMPLLRALPVLEAGVAEPCGDSPAWLALAGKVEASLAGGDLPPPTLAARHLLLFACEGLALGRGAALERFAGRADALAAALPADAAAGLGQDWVRTGWFSGAEDALAQRFAAAAALGTAARAGEPAAVALRRLDILGFHLYAPMPWVAALYRHVVVPCVTAAAEAGHDGTALALEEHAYLHHCRMQEDEEHTSAFFAPLAGPLTALGRRRRATGEPAAPASGPPLVAFVFQYAAEAAHTEVAGRVLGALARAPAPRIRPVVYLLDANPALERRFADDGIPSVVVGSASADPARALGALAQRARDDGAAATVTVSLPLWLAYLSGLRPAPVQVLWAHKRHPAVFPDVHGNIATGPVSGGERLILGRPWRTVRAAFHGLAEAAADRDADRDAAALRAGFAPGTVVLGTIAREEKIAQPGFLDMVTEVLREHPSAVFLWTGRDEHPAVREHFRRTGVADRTRFIGWVPVRVYVRVFDVFLSTFPQGGVLSEGEALAAGTPVVGMVGDNGILDANVWPVVTDPTLRGAYADACRAIFRTADGSALLPRAGDGAAYGAFVRRLVADPAWRAAVGEAGRAWVLGHFSDVSRYADDLATVLLDFIADGPGS